MIEKVHMRSKVSMTLSQESAMGLAARNTEPDITTGDAGRVALTFFFNLMELWARLSRC